MANRRIERVNELLRQEIARMIVQGEVKDPRVTPEVTITGARVAPDLRLATVYYSLLGGEEGKADVQKGLERSASFLRRSVGARLRLKYTPELVFRYDRSMQTGQEMDDLLDRLRREREAHEAELADADGSADADEPPVDEPPAG